jgi:uncharacterized protein YceK
MKAVLAMRAAVLALAGVLGGCATIVSKSTQTMTISSVPAEATVKIANASGMQVHGGSTPLTVTLKKGRGYFKAENYTVSFSKDGYQSRDVTVKGQVNGWYFGNILFGGLIGMLAIDPATGAMYTLQPKEVNGTLDALKVERKGGERMFVMALVKDLPGEVQSQLIPPGTN